MHVPQDRNFSGSLTSSGSRKKLGMRCGLVESKNNIINSKIEKIIKQCDSATIQRHKIQFMK